MSNKKQSMLRWLKGYLSTTPKKVVEKEWEDVTSKTGECLYPHCACSGRRNCKEGIHTTSLAEDLEQWQKLNKTPHP